MNQNCAEERDFDDILYQSSDNSNMDSNPPLKHSIAQWVAVIVLKENGHSELPRTAKTLLDTCVAVEFELKSGMQYLGCKYQLLKHLKMYPLWDIYELDFIEISLIIDGLPLLKSSSQSLPLVQSYQLELTPMLQTN